MKHILITTIAVVVLVGCGKKEQAKTPPIDPSKHERFLWAFETGGMVFTPPPPSVLMARFTSGQDNKLYAINGKTGVKKWAFGREHGPRSPAIGLDGTVYIGSGYPFGMLYAIDGNTGAKKWKFDYGNAYPGGCAIGVDDTVYIPFADERKLYALDGKTGTKKWEFRWRKDGFDTSVSAPAIGDDGTVYFGTYKKNKLYAVDGKTGTKKWEFETGGSMAYSPVIGTDGTLYIGSGDKKLYAIKTDSKGPAKSSWPMRGQNARHTGLASEDLLRKYGGKTGEELKAKP